MNLYRLTYLLPFLLHTTFISFSCQRAQLLHQWNRSTLLNKKQLVNQIGKGFNLSKKTFITRSDTKFNRRYIYYRLLHPSLLIHPETDSLNALKKLKQGKDKFQQKLVFYAARMNNLSAIKILKVIGANLHAIDKYGNNALHHAALFSSKGKSIEWLIDKGKIDIESKNKYQRTPLLCAAEKGNLPVLKILQEQGANLDATDQDGNNALHLASYFSLKSKVIVWLIDKAEINIENENKNQATPFLTAAKNGNLCAFKILKEKGANVYSTDQSANNALHRVALYASVPHEAIQWLLDNTRIETESVNKYHRTPFLCAAKVGNLRALQALKVNNAYLYAIDHNRNNALHLAAAFAPQGRVIQWLINTANIPIEDKNSKQKTPFLCATHKRNLSALKVLQKKGANIDVTDQYGNHALHYAACFSSKRKVMKWLFNIPKISIDLKRKDQKTPFLCAAETGNLIALQILFKKQVNLYATDQYGDNALHLAVSYSSKTIAIEWLITQVGFSIEAEGRYQRTPFLCAAELGNLLALELLKAKGANLYASDQNGDNALALAKKHSGNQSAIDWLEKQFKLEKRDQHFTLFKKQK